MTKTNVNFDPAEQKKFDSIATSWWDPDGESRPLHDLNPARLAYIAERVELKDATVIDVGCGGGILSESMAAMAFCSSSSAYIRLKVASPIRAFSTST